MRLAFRIRQPTRNEKFLRLRYEKERLSFNYNKCRLNSKHSSSISNNGCQERAKNQASATTTTSTTTRHVFRVISACVKTIFIAHFFCEYGYCIQPTIGASMLPTLQVLGDNVLISRSYRRGRGVQVGDVVSFASVIKPGQRVIKRVIGLPGDWVLRDTPPGSSRSKMIQVIIKLIESFCWLSSKQMP